MKIKELQKNKKRIHQKLHREEFQQYGTSILVDNIIKEWERRGLRPLLHIFCYKPFIAWQWNLFQRQTW